MGVSAESAVRLCLISRIVLIFIGGMNAFRFTLFAALSVAALPLLHARIGETKQDIQSRMLTKNGGAYVYQSREERLRETLELPYKYMFLMMPKGSQNHFFFKRPDAATTANADAQQQHDLYGWELHICFFGDNSALEFYRRHGDPMTVEEVAELFNLQAAAKGNAKWRRAEFSDILKTWKTSTAKPTAAAPTEQYGDVSEILPKSATRFVYAKVPDDVRESINFAQSIPAQILEYEQRITYEKYRQYVNKQSAISASKTAPTAAKNKKTKAPVANAGVRKVYPFDASAKKYVESEIFSGGEITRYAQLLPDVFYGGKPETSPTKDVRIAVNIPDRPDTAFDYDYETEDGSIRAKIYKSGVLFVDKTFDSNLRKYLEELYREQKQTRTENAKQSTGKF